MTHWREVLEQIRRLFRSSRRGELDLGIVNGEPAVLQGLLESVDTFRIGYDTLERSLSLLGDRAAPPGDETISQLFSGTFPTARLVRAQLHRARGLAHRDAAELRAALDILHDAGAT